MAGACEPESYKRIYTTKQEADDRITARGQTAMKNAYHCHHGDHWHIGARRKKDTQAASADKPVTCPEGCGKRTKDDAAMTDHLAQKHPDQAMAG